MLFGNDRVLKLAVVNKIVQAYIASTIWQSKANFRKFFSQIAQLTYLSQVNSVPIYCRMAMGNSPKHYFKTQKAISKPRRLFQNPKGYFKTKKAISKPKRLFQNQEGYLYM